VTPVLVVAAAAAAAGTALAFLAAARDPDVDPFDAVMGLVPFILATTVGGFVVAARVVGIGIGALAAAGVLAAWVAGVLFVTRGARDDS
jgi:hypothetical protein